MIPTSSYTPFAKTTPAVKWPKLCWPREEHYQFRSLTSSSLWRGASLTRAGRKFAAPSTPGALSAASIVAQAFTGPGDRVLVESPVYPNATLAIRHSGARLVGSPVDPDGWDLDAVGAVLRDLAEARLPDPRLPEPHRPPDDRAQREEYAAALDARRTIPVVDEAHQALALDGQQMPRPFAASPATITIGSASKTLWGGLRLGWIRSPRAGWTSSPTPAVGPRPRRAGDRAARPRPP